MEIELWPDVAPRSVEVFLGLAQGKGEYSDVRDPQKKVTITRPFFDGLTFHRVMKNFMLQGGCPNGNGSGDPGFEIADEINAKALGLDKQMALVEKQVEGKVTREWHPFIANLGPRYVQQVQQTVMPQVLKSMGIDPRDQGSIQRRQGEVVGKLQVTSLMRVYEMMGYEYDAKLPSKPMKKTHLAMANKGPNTNGSQFFINLADNLYLNGKHTVFGKVTKGWDVAEKIGNVKVAAGATPVSAVTIVSIRPIP